MSRGTLLMIIEFVIIVILAIFLIIANGKIKDYKENGYILEEETEEENQEESGEENANGVSKKKLEESNQNVQPQETTKVLGGTDSKRGITFQNAKIETENGTSKLYIEAVNNTGKDISNVSFNICLTDANRNVINKYAQSISNIKTGDPKTIEITVNKVENVEGFYVE